MPAQRPLVLVYQEFARQNFTAEEPTLDTLIAGPAYHLVDAPDDAALSDGGEYGHKFVGQPSGATPEDVWPAEEYVFADVPGNMLGAILDASSLQMFFSEAYVLIPDTYDDGGSYDATPGLEHEFTSPAVDFEATGVIPGDFLITTSSEDVVVVRTITSVGSSSSATFTQNMVRVSSGYAAAGIDAQGEPYIGASFTSLRHRVERRLTHVETTTPNNIAVSGNQVTVLPGHIVSLPGTTDDPVVMFGQMYFSYRSLRQDLAIVGEIEDARLIESRVGRIDERNPLAVALHIALQNTTTPINYFGITGDNLNGGLDRLQAYQAMAAETEAYKDLYAIVPLTEDLSVIAALKTVVEASAVPEVSQYKSLIGNLGSLPTSKEIAAASTGTTLYEQATSNYVVDLGVDTSEVRSGDIFTFVEIEGDNVPHFLTLTGPTDGLTGVKTATAMVDEESSTQTTWWIERANLETDPSFSGVEVRMATPDTIFVPAAEYSPLHVHRLIGLSLFGDSDNEDLGIRGNNKYFITAIGPESAGFRPYTVAGSVTWASDDTPHLAQISSPLLYGINEPLLITGSQHLILHPEGTFLDSSVVVGDLLEVTLTPTILDESTYSSLVFTYPIASIASNNSVRLAAGVDVAQENYTTAAISYRVIRTLDKAGQVDELINIAESISSSRVLAVWPDEVKVSGVQNGATGTQSFLPGYYMAVVVGAMTAGLPSHQGFTNLGVAGIDEIRHSSRYFSESQLTELSNSGIYLFAQNTPNTLPYCVHQLTTDVATQ